MMTLENDTNPICSDDMASRFECCLNGCGEQGGKEGRKRTTISFTDSCQWRRLDPLGVLLTNLYVEFVVECDVAHVRKNHPRGLVNTACCARLV